MVQQKVGDQCDPILLFIVYTHTHFTNVFNTNTNISPVCPLLLQEFRQKVMLGTPFVVIWLVGFIADLDIDSWLIKGLMYAGMWIAVQFLSK